jgi:hypothetical protein
MIRNLTALALASVLLIAAGCGDDLQSDETTRDEAGEVVGEGDVGALSLAVGDCIEAAAVGQVNEVPVVPCTDPHESEVVALFDLPEGDFPGAVEVSSIAEEECIGPLFADYVGIDYQASKYGFAYLAPTQETWDGLDDREVVCLVGDPTSASLTGSVKGSAE